MAYNFSAEVSLRLNTASLQAVQQQLRSGLKAASSLGTGDLAGVRAFTESLTRSKAGVVDLDRATKSLANTFTSTKASSAALNREMRGAGEASARTAKAFADVNQGARGAASSMEAFAHQAGLAARRYAAFALASGTLLKVAGEIKSAVSEAINFDREMVRLTQVSDGSKAKIKELEREITRLATTFGVSSSELAKTSVVLEQAGIKGDAARKSLEALAKAALAPNFDSMAQTTEGAIAVMRQFKIEATDLEGALGSMNAVAGAFAVEASDLIEVVRRVGGVFSGLAESTKKPTDSLNELLALFSSVRSATREDASVIANGLKTIFTRLQRAETVDALKELGVQLRYTREELSQTGRSLDLQDQFVGAYEAVRRLSQALNDIPATDPKFASIVEQLGGVWQLGRVIPLVQQFGEAQKALAVAQAGQTSLAVNAAQAQDALAVRLQKSKENWLELGRVVADSRGFQSGITGILSLADAISTLLKYTTPLIPALTALAAIKLGQAAIGAGSAFAFDRSQGTRPTVQRRASGGRIERVPGVGYGDKVPAMLEPGELIVPRSQAQKFATGGSALRGIPTYGIPQESLETIATAIAKNKGREKFIRGIHGSNNQNDSVYIGAGVRPGAIIGTVGNVGAASPTLLRHDFISTSGHAVETRALDTAYLGGVSPAYADPGVDPKNAAAARILERIYHPGNRSQQPFSSQIVKGFDRDPSVLAALAAVNRKDASAFVSRLFTSETGKTLTSDQRGLLRAFRKGDNTAGLVAADAFEEISPDHGQLLRNLITQSQQFGRFAGGGPALRPNGQPVTVRRPGTYPADVRDDLLPRLTNFLGARGFPGINLGGLFNHLVVGGAGKGGKSPLGVADSLASALFLNPAAIKLGNESLTNITLHESFHAANAKVGARALGLTSHPTDRYVYGHTSGGVFGQATDLAEKLNILPRILPDRLLAKYLGKAQRANDPRAFLADEAVAQSTGYYPDILAGRGPFKGAIADDISRVASIAIPGIRAASQRGPALAGNPDELEKLLQQVRRDGFASGGLVPGVGNTDSVPLNLPVGSFVINKQSTRKIGADKLASMASFANGGGIPGRGFVPALVMPGEHIFSPAQAARIGRPVLEKLNKFADGGSVGLPARTIDLGGTNAGIQAQLVASLAKYIKAVDLGATAHQAEAEAARRVARSQQQIERAQAKSAALAEQAATERSLVANLKNAKTGFPNPTLDAAILAASNQAYSTQQRADKFGAIAQARTAQSAVQVSTDFRGNPIYSLPGAEAAVAKRAQTVQTGANTLKGIVEQRTEDRIGKLGGQVGADSRQAIYSQEVERVQQQYVRAVANQIRSLDRSTTATEAERIAHERFTQALQNNAVRVTTGAGGTITGDAAINAQQLGFFGRKYTGLKNAFRGEGGGPSINSAGAFALLTAAPIASEAFRPTDATNAVRAGTTGGFTAGSAVAGATSLGLTGAVIGSQLGIGAGPAALIGAAIGLASGLQDARVQITEAKLGLAVQKVSDELQFLASGLKDFGPGSAAVISQSQADIKANNRDAAEEKSSYLYGAISNPTGRAVIEDRLNRIEINKQLPGLVSIINKEIDRQATSPAGKGQSPQDIVDSVLNANGGFLGGQADLIAKGIGSNSGEFRERLRGQAATSVQNRLADEANKKATTAAGQAANQLEHLAQAARASVLAMEPLGDRVKLLGGLFDGSPTNAAFNPLSRRLAEPGASGSGFGDAVGSLGGFLSPDRAKSLTDEARAVALVTRELPGALASANARRGDKDKNFSFSNEVSSSLIGAAGGFAGNAGFKRVLDLVGGQLTSGDIEKSLASGGGDLTKVTASLLKAISQPLEDGLKEVKDAVERASNEYITGLRSVYSNEIRVREEQGRLAEANLNLLKNQAGNRAEASGFSRDRAVDFLTTEQLNQPFRQGQATLAGGIGLNPAAIGARLGTLRPELLAAGDRVNQAIIGRSKPGGEVEFRAASENFTSLESESQKLIQALRNLTNTSASAAGTMEKLSQIQREEEARLTVGERLATEGPSDRSARRRGERLANEIASGGGRKLNRRNADLLFGATRLYDDVPQFNGLTGGAVRKQYLQRFALGAVLPAEKVAEKATLTGELTQAYKAASEAQVQLLQNQTSIQTEIRDLLARQQDAFLKGFQVPKLIDERAGASAKLGDVSTQLRGGKLFLDALPSITSAFGGSAADLALFSKLGSNAKAADAFKEYISASDALPGARGKLEIARNRERPGFFAGPVDKIKEDIAQSIEDKANANVLAIIDRKNNAADILDQAGLRRGADRYVNFDRSSSPQQLIEAAGVYGRQFTGKDANQIGVEAERLGNEFKLLEEKVYSLGEVIDSIRTPKVTDPLPRGAKALLGSFGFAMGGTARGTDTIPAMLTPGEFVVNAASSVANRGLLHQINASKGPVYMAEGGVARNLVIPPWWQQSAERGPMPRWATAEAGPMPRQVANTERDFAKGAPSFYREAGRSINLLASFGAGLGDRAGFGFGRPGLSAQRSLEASLLRDDLREGYRSGLENGDDALSLRYFARRAKDRPLFRANGGPVYGPSGRDVVPAMLTSGEFVLNSKAVARAGLANVQRFNDGGPVLTNAFGFQIPNHHPMAQGVLNRLAEGGQVRGGGQFSGGGDFGKAVDKFVAPAGDFSTAVDGFGKHVGRFEDAVTKLEGILTKYQGTVKVEGNQTVQVTGSVAVIGGGESASAIESRVKEEVERNVRKRMPDYF